LGPFLSLGVPFLYVNQSPAGTGGINNEFLGSRDDDDTVVDQFTSTHSEGLYKGPRNSAFVRSPYWSNVSAMDLTPCRCRREVHRRALIIDQGSTSGRAGCENATSETIIDRDTGMLCQIRWDRLGSTDTEVIRGRVTIAVSLTSPIQSRARSPLLGPFADNFVYFFIVILLKTIPTLGADK